MSRMSQEEILEEVKSQVDMSCHLDSNLQHFKYLVLGYRDFIINRCERSGYSPGSARDVSWLIGKEMAKRDLVNVGPNPEIASER